MSKEEIIKNNTKETIYHYAEMFRNCAQLWKSLYENEVGPERMRETLYLLTGSDKLIERDSE